ncbi:MAG TPA: Calx-beta domain-containing protein, partial [Vicinamibacterales bacterium]
MTTAYYNLGSGNFTQNWSSTGLIGSNDDWSGVPSITGFLAEATSASSYDPALFLTDAGVTLDVVANQSASATNGGVIEVDQGIANPTVGFQGSNAADVAGLIFYMDATNRQNVTFSANLRDLDASADASTQKVVLQYRIGNSGNWTNLASVADASDVGATKVTAISGVLPAAANGQSQIQIRIMTGNASGNDELIGVDDIVISSTGLNTPGSFSVGDASVAEGDAGTVDLTFTITRDGGSTGAVSVNYATADISALAGSDYVAKSGTLSFANGETSKTVTITVNADLLAESHETFALNLSGATGGATITDAQATGTIFDDDSVQPGSFSIGDVSVAEGNAGTTNMTFTVTRAGGSDGAVTVDFATANGTATVGSDYAAHSGTL